MRPAIRAGIGEGVVHASKMAVSKITVMFKSKVTELVDQLQAKFPALMVIPCMAINTMSGTDLLETYARTVSEPYHDRIVAMDETFFLTVSEDDIRKVSCDADLSMLSMVVVVEGSRLRRQGSRVELLYSLRTADERMEGT
jgi:hypothetical protein